MLLLDQMIRHMLVVNIGVCIGFPVASLMEDSCVVLMCFQSYLYMDVGKIIFPSDYPFKPPGLKMMTPNGRFKTDYRLCLSMSDYHPDTWNPAWSVSTILTGLLSFMVFLIWLVVICL